MEKRVEEIVGRTLEGAIIGGFGMSLIETMTLLFGGKESHSIYQATKEVIWTADIFALFSFSVCKIEDVYKWLNKRNIFDYPQNINNSFF